MNLLRQENAEFLLVKKNYQQKQILMHRVHKSVPEDFEIYDRHRIQPYICAAGNKVLCAAFFQESGQGLGRRPKVLGF